MAKTVMNLRVLHTQVGAWPKGHILSTSDLPEGADVDRLIKLGAVEETDDKRSGDAPLAPDTIYMNRVKEAKEAKPKEPAKI